MTYTGLSCGDIYDDNPETRNKDGYYHINDIWAFCNMTFIAAAIADGRIVLSCAGVEGHWRKISGINVSAGDDCIHAPMDGIRVLTVVLASVGHQLIILVVIRQTS